MSMCIVQLQEEDIGGAIDFNEDGNFLDDVLDEFLQVSLAESA
jgi:hypothetical protein